MSENTKIEWADHTFNPWTGCTKVGPGCDHCYAEAWAKRSGTVQWGPHAPRRRTTPANWREPLKWDRLSEQWVSNGGPRTRVFCASLADVFDNEVDPAWRRDLFALIARTPNLDWLLLTKRIGNALPMLDHAFAGMASNGWTVPTWPWPNVWLGATVVNQAEADRDVPKLLATPAAVRFLSIEPMLGSIDIRRFMWPVHPRWPSRYKSPADAIADGAQVTYQRQGLISAAWAKQLVTWVIAGGESGPKARPSHPDWFRSLRDQCAAAGVPFLFKQWGEFLPASANQDDPCDADVPESRLYWSDGSKWDRFDGQRGGVDLVARVGKAAAGRLLDGIEHNGFPSPTHDNERTSQ